MEYIGILCNSNMTFGCVRRVHLNLWAMFDWEMFQGISWGSWFLHKATSAKLGATPFFQLHSPGSGNLMGWFAGAASCESGSGAKELDVCSWEHLKSHRVSSKTTDWLNIIWLVVWNMAFIFPYIGNNDPSWLSYFSEGLKPPTSIDWTWFIDLT
jgi:hypothetical protein